MRSREPGARLVSPLHGAGQIPFKVNPSRYETPIRNRNGRYDPAIMWIPCRGCLVNLPEIQSAARHVSAQIDGLAPE